MKIQCAQCDFENEEDARYCESCGFGLRCPECQTTRSGRPFCRKCGKPLPAIQGALTRVRTPRHLAEQFLGSASSAEGENKLVTVLFADVVDSTRLIWKLTPERANRIILEPTLDRMIKAVGRYEGTVTQTPGDSIMAIFGAPIAHEDHAVRACHAALDMQEAIAALAADIKREHDLTLQVRIGLNSGQVLAKVIYKDGDAFVDYRAVGRTTHLASRLQEAAAPGTIALSRETFGLAKGFVRVGPFRILQVQGIDAPIEVCELQGIDTRLRIQARAARGLSKFVGRTNEMDLLASAAEHAASGRGQAVGLVGEAGVGKSRVFWEFTRSTRMQGWRVLDAGSVSYGKATSYLPLVDLLTRYFELQGRDDERRVRDKISSKVAALGDPKLQGQMPLFLGALGWGGGDQAWKKLAPEQRQRELFEALRNLLFLESRRQPLCVVFEDLHWIDDETQVFLDMLVESLPSAAVLLLMNYRPDYSPSARWAKKSYYHPGRIAPLTPLSASELLEALLGTHPDLAPVKKRLVELTAGNPLFLEEYVRTLLESGVLAGGAGQWRPIRPLLDVVVPQSIESLVAARIDRLRPRYKEILQCAAVIGNDVPGALLGAVAPVPLGDLQHGLRELQEAEFLYESAAGLEHEYTFKHSTTREVAYSSLVEERRKALHAEVAKAIVQLAPGRVDEHVERVAQHAQKGELWLLAVEYLQRSGEKAFGLYANAEAAGYFRGALDALKRLPRDRAALEQQVTLHFELRNALIALPELDSIRTCLEEIEPAVRELGDKRLAARYASYRCNHHFLAAEQRRAIEFGENGLRLADESGDRRAKGELLFRVAQCYHVLGNNRKALALMDESLAITTEERKRERFDLTVISSVGNRTWLVTILAECGDFAAGLAHAERALEIARQADHPLSEVLATLAKGHLLRRKGELEAAMRALELGMALSARYSLPMWRLRLESSLGIAYAHSGRADEGVELAKQSLARAEGMGLMVDRPMLHFHLGEALLLSGRSAEAFTQGKRALEFAISQENRRDEPWARLLVARARLAAGELDEAAQDLESAHRMATTNESRPLAAICQATLGLVEGKRGNRAAAERLAAAAHAAYAELGMRAPRLEP